MPINLTGSTINSTYDQLLHIDASGWRRVTLVSTTTVATNQCRDYLLRVTSVTPGSETVRLIDLQTGRFDGLRASLGLLPFGADERCAIAGAYAR